MEPLAVALAEVRAQGPQWESAYDAFVARLRAAGAGEAAPRAGDTLPDFTLPDARGRHVRLSDLARRGPLVLSFQRGGWCPYCRHELAAWARAVPALRAAGAAFAAVSGEVGGRAAAFGEASGLDAPLLCDVDQGVAMALGLAVRLPDAIAERYRDLGLDLGEVYGGLGNLLTIPATFVLDAGRVVRFAFADPDFRLRAEPADALAAVHALAEPA